jgi:hypothetical protein
MTVQQQSLDKAGIWVTTLCALHCLLLPVILPMLSVIGLGFIGATLLERTILGASLLVGAIALSQGVRRHRQVYPVGLLIAGGTLYWFKDVFGGSMEPWIILLGAGLIVTAHWVNLRLSATNCRLAPVLMAKSAKTSDTSASQSINRAA